jgi:hypothetical protein
VKEALVEAAKPQVAGGGAMSASPTAREVLRLLRTTGSTIDELRLILRVPRREVEGAVEELRLRGEPIVGGSEGLRLTEDPAELERYLEARRRRTAHIHRGTMRLRSTLRRMQEVHDEEEGLTLWPAA